MMKDKLEEGKVNYIVYNYIISIEKRYRYDKSKICKEIIKKEVFYLTKARYSNNDR